MTATALIDRAVKTSKKSCWKKASSWRGLPRVFAAPAQCAGGHHHPAIAVLIAFSVMFGQGISFELMSLGGIAIAIGAMVDAVIIMIENAIKHGARPGQKTALGNHP